MTIQLNGEPHDVPEPISVSQLLETLKVDPRRVAVEHNRLVVKKTAYQSTVVATRWKSSTSSAVASFTRCASLQAGIDLP